MTVSRRQSIGRDALLVGVGGAAGALARAGVGAVLPGPIGTLAVNVLGAFLLGLLLERFPGAPRARLLLGTGVMGGFTTYSLLAVDVAQFTLDSQLAAAIGYAAATLILGGLASWLGILAGRAGRAGRTEPAA
ncbi:fluoride efflux transporter FluC [Leucobacter luti]|uniref:fluoride efflux transporter FluC n=1 Tax=Leucobacter luti TaxID=340320 RepID=UPI003D05F6F5